MSDGYRWGKFIQLNLTELKKFEFYFDQWINCKTLKESELINSSFQTPFWIEHKQWFVVCEYSKSSALYRLYTQPICVNELQYDPYYKQLRSSTMNTMIENKTIKSVILRPYTFNRLVEQEITINYTRFVQATHLTFEIYEDSNSLFWSSIFRMIDITKIVKITQYISIVSIY
ncbi:hypothetical protein I4U23_022010 [Adineta vaga]|nr:hypothetical protein I4U23_022010 [Adineta vaga]